MARPKKVKDEDVEITTDAPEIEKEEVSGKKAEPVRIVAKFRAKDEDGNFVILSFDGEGKDIAEALNAVDFPKGVNSLVNVTLSQGSKKIEKALAPHKARATLEFKDIETFEAAFRGF